MGEIYFQLFHGAVTILLPAMGIWFLTGWKNVECVGERTIVLRINLPMRVAGFFMFFLALAFPLAMLALMFTAPPDRSGFLIGASGSSVLVSVGGIHVGRITRESYAIISAAGVEHSSPFGELNSWLGKTW